MSVLVIAKFTGDTKKFHESLEEREDQYRAWMDRSKNSGAIHHRFGVTGDTVIVIDEWESRQDFNAFFADPGLQAFISQVGSDGSLPEITYAEAVDSPDQF